MTQRKKLSSVRITFHLTRLIYLFRCCVAVPVKQTIFYIRRFCQRARGRGQERTRGDDRRRDPVRKKELGAGPRPSRRKLRAQSGEWEEEEEVRVQSTRWEKRDMKRKGTKSPKSLSLSYEFVLVLKTCPAMSRKPIVWRRVVWKGQNVVWFVESCWT